MHISTGKRGGRKRQKAIALEVEEWLAREAKQRQRQDEAERAKAGGVRRGFSLGISGKARYAEAIAELQKGVGLSPTDRQILRDL